MHPTKGQKAVGRGLDMEFLMLGYAALFVASFAAQMAVNADEDEDTSPEGGDLYDAGDYAARQDGTDRADTFGPEGRNSIAWFLFGGDDVLTGTEGDDYAEGGTGNDRLALGGGNDIIFGGDGTDDIDAGLGNDFAHGGLGSDTVDGNGGNDSLYGGDGDDTVLGGSGADALYGGAGADYLSGLGLGLADPGSGGADGADTLLGGTGSDTLLLGAGDTGYGQGDDDIFQIDGDPAVASVASVVADFAAGDRIEVLYDPTTDPETGSPVVPVLTVTATQDNSAALLTLDGVTIARIVGGQGLTAGDIRLIARSA